MLEVFQKEREVYGECEQVSMEHVMKMLQFKKQILEQFEGHKTLMNKTTQVDSARKKLYEKELIRELGALLEQLLVIDMENEKLLRSLLNSTKKQETAKQNLRMPFVPGESQPKQPDKFINKNAINPLNSEKFAHREKISASVNPDSQVATGAKKKKLLAYSKLFRNSIGQ